MRRFGGVQWLVSVLGVCAGLGCEDSSNTIVNYALPDAALDAGWEGGLDASNRPTSGNDGASEPTTKPDRPTKPPKPSSDASQPRDAEGTTGGEPGSETRDASAGTNTDQTATDAGPNSHVGDASAQDGSTTRPDPSSSQAPHTKPPKSTASTPDAGGQTPATTTYVADASDDAADGHANDTETSGGSTLETETPTGTDTSGGEVTVELDAGSSTSTDTTSFGQCGEVPDAGVCDGDILRVCADGVVVSIDCAAIDERCQTKDAPDSGAECGPDLDASTEPPEVDAGRVPPDLTGCSEVNLSPSLWSVIYVDSAEPADPPEYAFDSNLGTYWQTEASGVQPPHELVVDLGEERALLGLTYLARQDAVTTGTIANFDFYVSLDGSSWFNPVLSAAFANTKTPQFMRFTPVTARYVRLVVLRAQSNEPLASIAELSLLAAKCPNDGDEPPAPGFHPGSMGAYLNGVFSSVDPALGGDAPPPTLSQTGAFSQFQPLIANPGLIPYEVNQPLWSDHASKSRWLALPNDGTFDQSQERLNFDSVEPWQFPAGTVFIKHFELGTSELDSGQKARIETRFLIVAASGAVYGLTYRWNDDGTEAYLLSSGETRTLEIQTSGGSRSQTWTFPARADCDHCHNSHSGYVLGVNAWQLNKDVDYPNGSRDNQLERLRNLGAFNNPYPDGAHTSMAHAVSVNDTSAPVELRLKSYMAANCSHCHRPNAVVSPFDARFQVPLTDIVLLETEVPSSVKDYIVNPGLPFESEIFQRDSSLGSYGMPPIAKAIVDEDYVNLLQQWIGSL